MMTMCKAFAVASCLVLVAAAPPKASGAKLCVLRQADFRAFGTLVWTKPSVNTDEGGKDAYCVYRGRSGATGGVELDVFYPAGATQQEVSNTLKATLGSDPGAKYVREGVPGADESYFSAAVPSPGHFPFAANAVRRGDLVFSISLPASPLAKTEMLGLSKIVLARFAAR